MPKTSREIYAVVRANLPKKTGLTLNEWKLLVTISGPTTSRKAQVDWLRTTYGLGSVQAAVIVAELSGGNGHEESEFLLREQFSGDRESLLPIADKVLTAAQSFGVDVRVEPHKSCVPMIRSSEFAVVKPTSKHRVDLRLSLPGTKPTERLVPVKKSTATRMTHHVSLKSSDEVDAEVLGWLRKAYELNSK